MFVLLMAASRSRQDPPVIREQSEHVSNFHAAHSVCRMTPLAPSMDASSDTMANQSRWRNDLSIAA